MYNLKIGVIESLASILANKTKRLEKIGVKEIQLSCWDCNICTPENAKLVKEILKEGDVTISGVWGGWNVGPTEWNFTKGPSTIGIVPTTWRKERIACLKKEADFTAMLGVDNMTTHVGFMPEVPGSEEYLSFLDALCEAADYCKKLNIKFCFETGEETPIAVLRAIDDLKARGYDNIGINLDPANLLMYGKGNPQDAIDVFGKYITGVHVKDGQYPTNGNELGIETKVGHGRVDFECIIKKLHALNYRGPLTIEREIEGAEQEKDIIDTVQYLNNILKKF